MSYGNGPGGDGGDDDDIDELVEELSETNRLLRALITAGEEQAEAEEAGGGPDGDLWDIGDTTHRYKTEDEYERLRRVAATSTEVVRPYPGDVFESQEEKIQFYLEKFMEGYECLESVDSVFSEYEFSVFVRSLVLEQLRSGIESVSVVNTTEDLVDILEPGPGFFGVRHVETITGRQGVMESREVNIEIDPVSSPVSFNLVGGFHYYRFADPSRQLGFSMEGVQTGMVGGRKTISKLNQDLAIAIYERNDLDLPEEYEDLVPEELK